MMESRQAGAQRCCAPTGKLARGGGYWGAYWSQPVVAIGLGAAGDGEELFLELARDSAGYAFSDLDVVDGTNRRDFDRRPAEEDFVDNVKHFARDNLFLDRDFQVFGNFHDGIASDARQDVGGKRRSVVCAFLH